MEATLTKQQSKELGRLLDGIRSKMGETAKNHLEIAAMIHEARELIESCELDCSFTEWIEMEARVCRSQAYRLLAIHGKFGKLDRRDLFDVSAMYLLAEPVNEPAYEEAVAMASKGFYVSLMEARKLAAKYRQLAIESKSVGSPETADDSDEHVAVAETAADCQDDGQACGYEPEADDGDGDSAEIRSVGPSDDFSDRPGPEPHGEPAVQRQRTNPVAEPNSIGEANERLDDFLELSFDELSAVMENMAEGKEGYKKVAIMDHAIGAINDHAERCKTEARRCLAS